MPPPEYANQYDRVVYWPYTGLDGYGEVVTSVPEERVVRFDNSSGDARDRLGQRIKIDASVQTSADMKLDSLVWYGTLSDWQLRAYGTGVDTTVYQVVSVEEQDDLKNRFIARNYGLVRYKGKP